ncbi:MAG: carboxypeptidase-like regulatory domain-containing protein [Paludibacteraceae bacterium]|nr:carboxypeptidase-like regulatory domain-containing protein [Paludibacteraceae bacterium]
MSAAVFAPASATEYIGRVVDEHGAPIGYATVYMADDPVVGTATAGNGLFRLETDLPVFSEFIVSFIGYEKQILLLSELHADTTTIVLKEQPINLEEVVIAAKPHKQKNKRKRMQDLLAAVYQQMLTDFPLTATGYHIVSDVRMDADDEPWGMEQMIAQVVVLPKQGHIVKDQITGKRDTVPSDSIQFRGEYCKRFFDSQKRAQADSILATNTLEHLEKNKKNKMMRRAANAVDSGVVVHRALFALGNIRYDFEKAMKDIRHWTVSNESEGETVLTHTQTVIKYFGLFSITFQRHYILDSQTYSVKRFSEHADVKVTIPFGMKLNAEQLQMLNLLNMSEQHIQKFRLKRLRAAVDLNTIYQLQDGHKYTLEKNMVMNAHIEGEKQADIPVRVKATQRVTRLQTKEVKLMEKSEITRRIPRELVKIQ